MTNRAHVSACLEAAGEAAEKAGFIDLAIALDYLYLMFAAGYAAEAGEALVIAAEPIRAVLLACETGEEVPE